MKRDPGTDTSAEAFGLDRDLVLADDHSRCDIESALVGRRGEESVRRRVQNLDLRTRDHGALLVGNDAGDRARTLLGTRDHHGGQKKSYDAQPSNDVKHGILPRSVITDRKYPSALRQCCQFRSRYFGAI